MNNISVIEDIIEELKVIGNKARDPYIIAATQALTIKYKKELQDERNRNALEIVEYKIAHLVKQLV